MRLCALRGAFAMSTGAEGFVLHDPRAWLGIAFHKVMEVATRPGATDETIQQAWAASVKESATAAALHPLDARYASPERWPNYFLVRQRAFSSAQRAIESRASGYSKSPQSGGGAAERLLLARGGRLAGRPDRFDGQVLTEYKSSLPDVTWIGANDVLEGYRRQLRLYAVIIAETYGRWPLKGRIVAASGQTMEVDLEPAACEAEADEALVALESLDRGLAAHSSPDTFAHPGNEACGTCPFKAICPAFWPWLAAAGSSGLPDTSAAGELDRVELGQDGDLYTAYLAVDQRGLQAGLHPLVLRRSIHGDLTTSPKRTGWKVVSAKMKTDGRLRADLATSVFTLDSLPSIVTV
jgi:hypothetical protein